MPAISDVLEINFVAILENRKGNKNFIQYLEKNLLKLLLSVWEIILQY
jgi:hypothetical protein